jgi:hypothetical protein
MAAGGAAWFIFFVSDLVRLMFVGKMYQLY